ncbi:MAG TPA: TlpA disulfide reductase family protein [Steroidobacteraceae bacterium]|nr:TlpA disulfide reductase family protein [Steroidobacteraceae bacterium]
MHFDEHARGARRAVLKALGAAALLAALSERRAEANDLRLGASAPPASLVTLDGQKIATSDLLGHVVILTFWATWCDPCREELPLLSGYAERHAADGLRILGFSLDTPDKLREVRQVAQTLKFPVGLMANSSAPGYGRIWRLPVSFTIDRAGRLVDNGWKDKNPAWTADSLERIVTPLLAKSA